MKRDWKTSCDKIEIEITSKCNIGCANCDRSCGVAPSDEMMTLKQIENFVVETLYHNVKWTWIRILGGEPALHPDFLAIVNEVLKIKEYFPATVVQVISNHYGDEVQAKLDQLPADVVVRGTNKKPNNPPLFTPANMAPVDDDKFQAEEYENGCWVTDRCGLGLSRYGYYPCGAGAAIDRVFGLGAGEIKLHRVNVYSMKMKMNFLCQYCGHFKDNPPGSPGFGKFGCSRVQETSVSWQEAITRFNEGKRGKLELYPERKL